jgi:hypothetical protein
VSTSFSHRMEPWKASTWWQIETQAGHEASRSWRWRKATLTKAIAALNGTKLGCRALNVNEARPKAERGAGGFREGYGGAPSVASAPGNSEFLSDGAGLTGQIRQINGRRNSEHRCLIPAC